MALGIEKTLEVFDDLEKMGVECIKVAKSGGKVLGNIGRIVDIIKSASELVKDAPGSLPELRDLDGAESGRLAERSFLMVRNLIEAVKA